MKLLTTAKAHYHDKSRNVPEKSGCECPTTARKPVILCKRSVPLPTAPSSVGHCGGAARTSDNHQLRTVHTDRRSSVLRPTGRQIKTARRRAAAGAGLGAVLYRGGTARAAAALLTTEQSSSRTQKPCRRSHTGVTRQWRGVMADTAGNDC